MSSSLVPWYCDLLQRRKASFSCEIHLYIKHDVASDLLEEANQVGNIVFRACRGVKSLLLFHAILTLATHFLVDGLSPEVRVCGLVDIQCFFNCPLVSRFPIP
jgi:hypothetical protein